MSLLKIFKHSIFYSFANQVPALANLFLLPLITPFLKPADYAIYGLSTSYIGLLGAFSSLGLIMHFQNSYFKYPKNFKAIWSEMMGFLIWWRMFYGLVVFVLLWFVFRNRLTGIEFFSICLLVVIPAIFFDLLKTIGPRFFQYEQKHRYVYSSTMIASVINLVITFSLIYFFRLGFIGWFAGAFAGSLFQFLFFYYHLFYKNGFKFQYKFKWLRIKRKLKTSLPVIPHSYSNFIMNSADRIILDTNKVQLSQIGLYNVAYSFSNYYTIFNNSTNSVLTPIYYKLFAEEEKGEIGAENKVRDITELWFVISLALASLISLWTKSVFLFLYRNPEISISYTLVNFLLFAGVYRSYYIAVVDKNIYYENSKSVLLITLSAASIAIIINVIFVPFYGVIASVAATFVSYLVMGFIGFCIKPLKRLLKVDYHPLLFLMILVTTAIVFYYLQEVGVIVKLIVTILVLACSVLYYLVRGKRIVNVIKKFM